MLERCKPLTGQNQVLIEIGLLGGGKRYSQFSGDATLPIPAGKVAVIEQVSASGALQYEGTVQLFVRCRSGTQEVNHSLPMFSQGQVNGLTIYAGSQPFKCYATAPPGILGDRGERIFSTAVGSKPAAE